MTKIYKHTDDFIDDLTIKHHCSMKHENVGMYLWNIAINRNKSDGEDTSLSYADVVIDYLSSKQTKLHGHLVAPIVLCTRGMTGYCFPKNYDGSMRYIYMTKDEVDTFNENFTERDHKAIRRFARLGR